MEILSFDLEGKFAHFRKYYTNNTALSYFIPPRTTLMGMLGAILGMDKDSYYEKLASDQIRLGVRAMGKMKKSFHKLNFLKINSSSDFRGQKGRIQTPFELVTPEDIRKGMVRYRVYVSPHQGGTETFSTLKTYLLEGKSTFSLSLGPANLLGSLGGRHLYQDFDIEQKRGGQSVLIHSAVNAELIERLEPTGQRWAIDEELHPGDFLAVDNRELKQMIRVMHTTDGSALKASIQGHGKWYEIKRNQSIENITFLE